MGKEKILVRPLFNYNIDFKKLLFFLQVPLSFLLQVIFAYKTKKGEVVLFRSSAVLVDYACKQFLISLQRNGGTEDKKKKEIKGKTIFLDPVVCLVGPGAQHDLGPKLLIAREKGGGGVAIRAC